MKQTALIVIKRLPRKSLPCSKQVFAHGFSPGPWITLPGQVRDLSGGRGFHIGVLMSSRCGWHLLRSDSVRHSG